MLRLCAHLRLLEDHISERRLRLFYYNLFYLFYLSRSLTLHIRYSFHWHVKKGIIKFQHLPRYSHNL